MSTTVVVVPREVEMERLPVLPAVRRRGTSTLRRIWNALLGLLAYLVSAGTLEEMVQRETALRGTNEREWERTEL